MTPSMDGLTAVLDRTMCQDNLNHINTLLNTHVHVIKHSRFIKCIDVQAKRVLRLNSHWMVFVAMKCYVVNCD